MGFKILLIATKGSTKEEDFTKLGFETTDEFSQWKDHGVASSLLNSGYRIFFIMDQIDPDPQIFESGSKGSELMALYIHENMLVNYVTHWKNSNMQWSVLHNCQESVDHLEIEGNPPKTIEKLKEEKKNAQLEEEDVDHFFDIPSELFTEITGYIYNFRYDFKEEKPWEVLTRKG